MSLCLSSHYRNGRYMLVQLPDDAWPQLLSHFNHFLQGRQAAAQTGKLLATAGHLLGVRVTLHSSQVPQRKKPSIGMLHPTPSCHSLYAL